MFIPCINVLRYFPFPPRQHALKRTIKIKTNKTNFQNKFLASPTILKRKFCKKFLQKEDLKDLKVSVFFSFLFYFILITK